MRKAHFGEQETIYFPAIPGVLAVTLCAQPAGHATSAAGTEDIALAHLLTQALPQLPGLFWDAAELKVPPFP